MAGDTYYDVLGADPASDASELRRAYLARAREHHPDFHVDDDPATRLLAEERMRSINDAWHTLGDAARRRRYDSELQSPGRAGVHAAGSSGGGNVRVEPETASGTGIPKWMVIAPALCLIFAVVLFAVGFVTGLVGLLAAGLVSALLGAALFVVIPVVALNRSKRG